MGRPSLYTDETVETLLDRVLTNSLHAVCQMDDMPDESTVYKWLKDKPDFFQNYTRAREIRGFWRQERGDKIAADMRAGLIDPAMARVEMDLMKWQAGRENPKAMGDAMTLKGDKENPLQVQGSKGLSEDELMTIASRRALPAP